MIFVKSVAILFLLQIVTAGNRRRQKETKIYSPNYDIYPSAHLPSDVQVTSFLQKDQTKRFDYWSLQKNLHLTAIVTACSSQIEWTVSLKKNVTDSESYLVERSSREVEMVQLESQLGLYSLDLKAVDGDSYVHIYISTETNGPEALKGREARKLLLRRQRNNKLAIKWDPSLVDPQGTEYCLIISGARHYGTFCGAEADRYGVLEPGANYQRRPVAAERREEDRKHDPMIVCTDKKTHYTFLKPKLNQPYFFSLFAVNRQTNFTYAYASNSTTLSNKLKPTSLRDGKLTFINLKDLDGKAVLRYKVGRKSRNPLEIYVMPCGGAVDVQIAKQHQILDAKRTIEGFGKLTLPNPEPGARYHIKIFSTNGEELRRTSGVELYATSRRTFIPLPDMPTRPVVKEYVSLRACDAVTIGWLPSPGRKTAHYCLVVKEGKLRDGFRQMNQCGLESRLKKSADFAMKFCKDIKQTEGQVLIQRVGQLKPGKSYIIQVTVKKPRGKTVSYDLVQVQTSPKCELRPK